MAYKSDCKDTIFAFLRILIDWSARKCMGAAQPPTFLTPSCQESIIILLCQPVHHYGLSAYH